MANIKRRTIENLRDQWVCDGCRTTFSVNERGFQSVIAVSTIKDKPESSIEATTEPADMDGWKRWRCSNCDGPPMMTPDGIYFKMCINCQTLMEDPDSSEQLCESVEEEREDLPTDNNETEPAVSEERTEQQRPSSVLEW